MWGLRFRAIPVGFVAALSMLAVPGSAWAGGPGKWTKLGLVDNSAQTLSMVRTADGSLHVAWLAKRATKHQTVGQGLDDLAVGQASGHEHAGVELAIA